MNPRPLPCQGSESSPCSPIEESGLNPGDLNPEIIQGKKVYDFSLNTYFKEYKKDFFKYLVEVRKVKEEKHGKSKKATWYINDLLRLPKLSKPSDIVRAKPKENAIKALRNFIHYLTDMKGITSILGYPPEKWLSVAKIDNKVHLNLTFVTKEEIKEAFNKIPANLKTFYKLLVYTGGRGTHLKEMIDNFTKDNLFLPPDNPKVAYYLTADYSSGTKNTFFVFFPSKLVEELEGYKLPDYHPDTLYRKIMNGRVNVKNIRKFHANLLLENEVQESIVDYMQGRTPSTVVGKHYTNLNKQAVRAYAKVIDKFPF